MAEQFTAIIPAGGRFTQRSDSSVVIKALLEINGKSLLEILLLSLSRVDAVGRTIVVGPKSLHSLTSEYEAVWIDDTGSLLGNVQAGIRFEKLDSDSRIAVFAADMVHPKPESIAAFLFESSGDAKLTIPLISKASFEAAYPGSPSTFVKLKEGEVTTGSMLTCPAGLIENPPPAVAALLGNRKSQIAMAKALGWGVVWGFMTGSLSIDNLEARITKLVGVNAKAIRDSAPDLAMDIDDERDLEYAASLSPSDPIMVD